MKRRDNLKTYVPALAGAISAVLGLAVMAGWYAQIPAVVLAHPEFAPMQFNTALGFILLGFAAAVFFAQRMGLHMRRVSVINKKLKQEIAERKLVQKSLMVKHKAIETSINGISTSDLAGRLTYINRASLTMWGFAGEGEILGRHVSEFLESPEEAAGIIERILENGTYIGEVKGKKKDGSLFDVQFCANVVRDEMELPLCIMISCLDITEKRMMEEAIKYQAYYDLVTELPNRMLFMDRLNLALAQAQRTRSMTAVLFLDLDRFKNINDTLGHKAGDQLLKEVAGRLKSCVRESDTVARIGGDEYTILLHHITQEEDAYRTARKLQARIREPYLIEGYQFHITVSIGISLYPGDGEQADTLFKSADVAMYYAKETGRNNYQFYNSAMNTRTIERMAMESSLRQTLERGELIVRYQPQLCSRTRQIICAEALVRWQHPAWGLLSPKQFVPLAEETGLIMLLDEWVLRTACAQNRAWQEAGYPLLKVTVNISAGRFQQPDFVEMVSRILRDTCMRPEFLELEITESTAMQDVRHAVLNMTRLNDMGVSFSIDDFGTGYSSLSYLKKLPIQKLKIDRSFISGLTTDPDDQAIVKAVIAMSHSLKLEVVAEGVETEDQFAFLQGSGCDGIQGFLFGEAAGAEEFNDMIMLYK